MRRSVLAAALPAALIIGAILPVTVAAFPLTTCTMDLVSTDGSGAPIDTATGGAVDATQDDPFVVDWDGQVGYVGSTVQVIKDYTYGIAVFGVPTPLQGGDPNTDEDTEGEGAVGIAANSPFRVAGLYHVTGTYSGEGGTCTGSGWFLLRGDPIGTVPWIVGLVLAVLGGLGLVAGLRGRTLTAIVGGVLAGLGVDLLLISHAILPLAELTPLVVLLVGVVLGIVLGLLGRGRAGGDAGTTGASATA